nr:MAG TPA: hypothetical protein [Caudoviricetes sp.]
MHKKKTFRYSPPKFSSSIYQMTSRRKREENLGGIKKRILANKKKILLTKKKKALTVKSEASYGDTQWKPRAEE